MLFLWFFNCGKSDRVRGDRIDLGCYEYGSYPASENDQIQSARISLSSYPNPVYQTKSRNNTSCMIEFTLPYRIKKLAEIEIYNIKGQKIKTLETNTNLVIMAEKAGLKSPLIKEKYETNKYSVIWDLKNESAQAVSSGIYLYRLKVDGKALAVKKMTILK